MRLTAYVGKVCYVAEVPFVALPFEPYFDRMETA